eukprot:PhM_4_TR1950/c1_g1_i1/m.40090/K14846/RPF1; ribosome production factor 1
MVKLAGKKKKKSSELHVTADTPKEVCESRVEAMRMKQNKLAKSDMYHRLRGEKIKAKRARRIQRQADIKKYGKENCPVMVEKSQDTARELDATMDVEVDAEQDVMDEFTAYFNKQREPKVMITTCFKPCKRVKAFVKELKWLIPNTKYYTRRTYPLREVCAHAAGANFTHVVSVNQSHGQVCGLIVSHLPEGPTARFRVSNLKLHAEVEGAGERTEHYPELFFKNFATGVGRRVHRLMQSLFPTTRDFQGRAIATFLNKRDFIFVRAHRYVFKGTKDVAMQELGPRFTLRLRELYAGTFADCDPATGSGMDVEFLRKREKSRRDFAI